MALSIIQTGTSLQLMNDSGGLTPLTLPAGITLSTTVKPRWTIYNNNVILVNTPSQPLAITSDGIVRVLTPKPPRLAPTLSGASGGTLTGFYTVKETFVTLDVYGNILSESDYSPLSSKVGITTQFLKVSNIDTSPNAITLRRLYRTTDNGAIFFQWVDLDGNIDTTIQDDLADAGLSIFSAPVLGTPPRLTAISQFRGRLFGVGDTDIDTLRYTEAGVQYAWPVDNTIPIEGAGNDQFGIVAFGRRREALGVGRRNILSQIVGTGIEANGTTDLSPVIVSREVGMQSQESTCVFRDVVYFLWQDGVYSWGPQGITCVSNGLASGKGNVRSWFATDDFFNRSQFANAFAHIDIENAVYRLFLCSAGSNTIDSWVEYNIDDQVWVGPHKTGLFTPVSAFTRTTAADQSLAIIGGPASVFQETDIRTDGFNTPIVMDVIGKRHDMQVPDQDKYFGELSLHLIATPGTIHVRTITGALDATRAVNQYRQMNKARIRFGRLGNGKHAQVEFMNGNVGEDVRIMGYEIDPVTLIGRR